jgi:hypothetical protein
MFLRRVGWGVFVAAILPTLAFAGAQKPCVTAEEATKLVNKDVCVTGWSSCRMGRGFWMSVPRRRQTLSADLPS